MWTDWTRQGDVALVRQDGGQAKVEFPRGKAVFQTAGNTSHVRVSPSGDAVAFLEHPMTMDDGGNVVWVEASGTAHRVSEGWASEEGLAWSPDGREIWFTASRTGVNRALFAASRSGSVRVVASIPGTMTLHDILLWANWRSAAMPCAWSCRSVPSVRNRRRMFPGLTGLNPKISRRTAGSSLHRGWGRRRARVWRVRERSHQRRYYQVSDGEGFAFLPDGKSVLTMLPRENTHLNVVPLGAGQPRVIDGHGLAYQDAQIFPDGRKLLAHGSMPGQGGRFYTQSMTAVLQCR